MKVKELIAMLQEHSPDDEVLIEQPSRDYWRTILAAPIREVQATRVSYSLYHETNQLPSDDTELDDLDDDYKPAVVIRGRGGW